MSQGHFGNLCDTNNFGDPVVLYDSFEDRWFITDFAFTLDGSGNVNPQHAFQCFAVSKTGDPVNGGWNFYSIEAPGGLGDYPKFGIWPDGIYMSANMFGYAAGASFIAPRVWAFNKQQMYAGDPRSAGGRLLRRRRPTSRCIPANARLQTGTPPPGTPEYFTSTEEFLNALTVYKFHVDWDKISTSTFTGPDVPLAPTCWPSATPANASTPANAADVLAIRAMAQTQYTNIGGAESLWVDHTVDRGEIPTAELRRDHARKRRDALVPDQRHRRHGRRQRRPGPHVGPGRREHVLPLHAEPRRRPRRRHGDRLHEVELDDEPADQVRGPARRPTRSTRSARPSRR